MQAVQRLIVSIGLPVWMLIGAVAGIAAGVVFGERAAVLQPIGSAYAMMLQVAVYPYLLCSLLYGVGRLTPMMARRLFSASWAVYLFMWAVTFIGKPATASTRHSTPIGSTASRAPPVGRAGTSSTRCLQRRHRRPPTVGTACAQPGFAPAAGRR